MSVQSVGVGALDAIIGVDWQVEPDLAALIGLGWLLDARYVLGASALVQALLAFGLVLAVQARRDAVLQLVAQGRGDLPIAAIVRRRRSLLRPAYRRRLACSVRSVVCAVRQRPRAATPNARLCHVCPRLGRLRSLNRLRPQQARR
jgi:hypothetical protein